MYVLGWGICHLVFGVHVTNKHEIPITFTFHFSPMAPTTTHNVFMYIFNTTFNASLAGTENEEQIRSIDGLVHGLVRQMNAKELDDQTVEIATKKNTDPTDETLGQGMYRAENVVHRVKLFVHDENVVAVEIDQNSKNP